MAIDQETDVEEGEALAADIVRTLTWDGGGAEDNRKKETIVS